MPAAPEILQAISNGELDQAFVLANAYAQAEAPGIRADLSTIESGFKLCKSEYLKNKISFDEYSRHAARASDALCQLLSRTSDIHPCLSSAYHALTCDRDQQSAIFEEKFKERKANGEKIQFYYLYGGKYQSHESLSKRLVQERGGMRRGLALKASANFGIGSVYFDLCEDLANAKLQFITRLCEAFGITSNAYARLEEKRLDFILQESSVLRGLKGDDFALCFIEVSKWDNKLVPIVGEWFVNEFCSCTMRPEAPICLFFFGVNYKETDERIPREIEVALRNAQNTFGLPELGMVEETNLEDWIKHYARALSLANNTARDELLDALLTKVRAKQQANPRKQVPGKEQFLHMDDVETALKKVIDRKNE